MRIDAFEPLAGVLVPVTASVRAAAAAAAPPRARTHDRRFLVRTFVIALVTAEVGELDRVEPARDGNRGAPAEVSL